jgi:phosphoribosylaminoimidazolecarboxamide formyltransferase/IMP cyclohydrolase
MRELEEPAAVIIKHANPCGVAVAPTIEEAWERALAADPVSAFGCVALLNRPVSGELGQVIAEHFVEVLVAPGFDDQAVEALQKRQALRILVDTERRRETPGERDFKRVLGGLLLQDRDLAGPAQDEMRVVCGKPTDEQWTDLVFAWGICKHVSSNAIVLARGGQTIGIGAGQMSRVDAVRIAVENARIHKHDLAGAVLASDAFFPFPDGPQIALEAGVSALIQPGGSRRDQEVVDAVTESGAAMVFTGVRHFRH